MIAYRIFPCLFFLSFLLASCEQVFLPEPLDEPLDLVVEGYVEAGEQPRPPYVILTRSQPFFAQIGPGYFNDFFVHDARVEVSDGSQTVVLEELCLDELTADQQDLLLAQLGIPLDSLGINFCAYLDLSFSMLGQVGKTYELRVEAEDQVLTSRTTIPAHVPVDSFYFTRPSEEAPDTLRELRGFITDPAGELNYYRFLNRVGEEPYYPGFNSVVNDRFFDGENFEFPLPKGEPRSAEIDPETFGFFTLGDSVTVRWLSIDQAQYDFWNTLEFNAVNQGPFSSYTRVDTNIEGGLGIWGGFSASYYQLVVE